MDLLILFNFKQELKITSSNQKNKWNVVLGYLLFVASVNRKNANVVFRFRK